MPPPGLSPRPLRRAYSMQLVAWERSDGLDRLGVVDLSVGPSTSSSGMWPTVKVDGRGQVVIRSTSENVSA